MEKIKKDNLPVKIIAVAVAVILWFYVSYIENKEITLWVRNVPITVVGEEQLNDSDLALCEISKKTVDVKVKTRRLIAAQVNNKRLSASVDLSNINSVGEKEVSVSIKLPLNNISLLDVRPSIVDVTIDDYFSKEIDITPSYKGNAANEFIVGDPIVNPKAVTVSGCRSAVDNVYAVFSDAVELDDAEETIAEVKNIKAVDQDGNEVENVSLSVSVADITYPILGVRTVPVVVSLVGEDKNTEYEVNAKALTESIQIEATQDEMASISEIKTEPIDVSSLTQNGEVTAKLIIPENINVKAEDEEVTVRFYLTKKE